jgi:hypothetical protein
MWLYPGRTGFTYPFQHPFGPEVLKAWNLDISSNKIPDRQIIYHDKKSPRENHEKKSKPIQQKLKSCTHCATRN